MRHQINAAIKQALCKRFLAEEIWNGDMDAEGFRYRVVFEMIAIPGREKRAIRYVDIVLTDDLCLTAQDQNRKLIKIDCTAPGSIEALEDFIQKNCFDLYIEAYKAAELADPGITVEEH